MADEKPTGEELLYYEVAAALEPIIRRAVHPETTHIGDGPYSFTARGSDIGPSKRANPAYTKKYGKPPLEPRYRLSTRLALMLAVTRIKNDLMKQILADEEATADAKKHKEHHGLEALRDE